MTEPKKGKKKGSDKTKRDAVQPPSQVHGGPQACLEPIGSVDLLEDPFDASLHRFLTEVELVRDLFVGRAGRDHGKDLDLFRCQSTAFPRRSLVAFFEPCGAAVPIVAGF